MDKLNELERIAKWNADNFEPVTVAGTKDILAIAEAFRELEKERNAFESNYNGEIDLRKQIQNNWRRLAAASGWVDSRDQYAADNDLPRQFDSATEMAKSWKQRAETAEAEAEDTDKTMRAYSDQLVKVTAELVAAQAQLAELAKQDPYGYVAESPCSSGYGGMMHEFSIDRCDAEHDANQAEGFVIELFTNPAPAADLADLVPGKLIPFPSNDPEEIARNRGWNECIDEMLRRIEGLK